MTRQELEDQRIQAETEKFRAEAEASRRTTWRNVAEFVKVTGAICATLAAIYAGITTYRITQLEARLATDAKSMAESELARAVRARDTARQELAVARTDKAHAEQEQAKARQQLAKLVAEVSKAQGDLQRAQAARPDVRPSVGAVSRELGRAADAAARALPTVVVTSSHAPQDWDAEQVGREVAKAGFDVTVQKATEFRTKPERTEVVFGSYFNHEEAKALDAVLRKLGIPPVVTRQKSNQDPSDRTIRIILGFNDGVRR